MSNVLCQGCFQFEWINSIAVHFGELFFGKLYSVLNLGSNDTMKIFKNLKFWSIEGFVKIHHYRFIGDRGSTLIFNIDIIMIIFILKRAMNTNNFGSLKNLHFTPTLDSDRILTPENVLAAKCYAKGTDM